jgi:hypothetical protein
LSGRPSPSELPLNDALRKDEISLSGWRLFVHSTNPKIIGQRIEITKDSGKAAGRFSAIVHRTKSVDLELGKGQSKME